jgi:hypothetical protein
MRDAKIYESPKCAIAPRCKSGWELWCRGCCLTFCKTHIDRAIHGCVSRDKMSQASRGFTSPEARPVERGLTPSLDRKNETMPANGTVHRNGSHGKGKR